MTNQDTLYRDFKRKFTCTDRGNRGLNTGLMWGGAVTTYVWAQIGSKRQDRVYVCSVVTCYKIEQYSPVDPDAWGHYEPEQNAKYITIEVTCELWRFEWFHQGVPCKVTHSHMYKLWHSQFLMHVNVKCYDKAYMWHLMHEFSEEVVQRVAVGLEPTPPRDHRSNPRRAVEDEPEWEARCCNFDNPHKLPWKSAWCLPRNNTEQYCTLPLGYATCSESWKKICCIGWVTSVMARLYTRDA